ncbi:nucleopolyhedrovirus P10 family protein [Streptomyces sp. NPDC003717]|uniref:nucleopolyhedrovirus P10 family protein n=1 Tax=Streptomyces sp. NPDC003717 TaxID=3154276 RepID=UPI0033A17D87
MTTADRWKQAVRESVRLGRLLPLGGAPDGAWIAERAVRQVLTAAAERVPGVRPDGLRIGPADPEAAGEPAVPAPPSALPPGPLRVTADFAATPAEPLPEAAARLRAALEAAAAELGLTVTEVDLRATDLLESDATPAAPAEPDGPEPVERPGAEPGGGEPGRVAEVVRAVAGVARLTDTLGRPVRVTETAEEERGASLPRRHVRVELAVAAGHRPVEVARRVRAVVADALPDHPSVAVLVSAVDA